MGNIFITSDTHFGHDKPFIWRERGFNSVEEMNEAIVQRWNEIVTPEDEVYHLGDVMLGDTKQGINYLRRLNGKIWILTGNHDTTNRIQEYVNIEPRILHIGLAAILKYHKYTFYLSHYPTLTANYDGDEPLNRRVINLCGHNHTTDPFYDWDLGLIFHTEMDTHDCRPWLLDDIIDKIKYKLDK